MGRGHQELGRGGTGALSFSGDRAPGLPDENSSGDGWQGCFVYTAMWICLIPLNPMLKNGYDGNLCVRYILPQF